MVDLQMILLAMLAVLIGGVLWSQSKFKNKMLCYFIRPNRQRIKKWVPIHSKHVRFDRGKYGTELYIIDPNCIALEWYDGGINKLFPVLVPTLEFKWDTPNPQDPTTFESTWHTPEARDAAWEEHEHVAFARATAQQAGKKSRFPDWFFPVVIIVVLIVVGYLVYSGNTGLESRLHYIEQQIKLGQ